MYSSGLRTWRPRDRHGQNPDCQIGVILPVRAIRAPEFASACSCTIETMPSGTPMTLNTQPGSSEESIGFEEVSRQVERQEKLITILAISLGVMIVAAIAVLMGMT